MGLGLRSAAQFTSLNNNVLVLFVGLLLISQTNVRAPKLGSDVDPPMLKFSNYRELGNILKSK